MKNKWILIAASAFMAFGAVSYTASTFDNIEPEVVNAAAVTYSFTIQTSDFNTTSYVANNGSHDFTATCTSDDSKTMTVACTSSQVMQSSSAMQWQKNAGYIYNTTDLGTIKSVTVNSSSGTFTTYYGTAEHPTSDTTVGNGYFTVKVGNATGKTSSIVVVFELDDSVTGITLDKTSGEVQVGRSISLTATVRPDYASNKDVVWTSSDDRIAKVVNGEVTGISEGEAVIYATTADGDCLASCTVNVVPFEYYDDLKLNGFELLIYSSYGDSTYYLENPSKSVNPSATANKGEATPLLVQVVEDNTYTLSDGNNYLYYTSKTSMRFGAMDNAADKEECKWNIEQNGGSTSIQNVGSERFIKMYNASDFRCYNDASEGYAINFERTNMAKFLDLSVDTTSSASKIHLGWSFGPFDLSVDKNTASTATDSYYPGNTDANGKNYTSTRFYKNSRVTLSTNSFVNVQSIVFEATSATYASALSGSSFTNATAVADDTTITVTPIDGLRDVVIDIGGACGFASILVRYIEVADKRLPSTFMQGSKKLIDEAGVIRLLGVTNETDEVAYGYGFIVTLNDAKTITLNDIKKYDEVTVSKDDGSDPYRASDLNPRYSKIFGAEIYNVPEGEYKFTVQSFVVINENGDKLVRPARDYNVSVTSNGVTVTAA